MLSANPKFATNGITRLIIPATSMTCATNDGDLKVAGLGRRLNETKHVDRLGQFFGAGLAGRRYPVLSVSEKIRSATAAAAPFPMRDFLTGTGGCDAFVGTLGVGAIYTVDVEYTSKDLTGVTPDDVWYFNDVDFNSYDWAVGEPDMFAFKGFILGPILLNGVVIAREIGAGGT